MKPGSGPTTLVVLLLLLLLSPIASRAQTVPAVQFLGFSADIPPGSILSFRQAVAHAIDRRAVAGAVASLSTSPAEPAAGIQPPRLPGYNAAVKGYAFSQDRAKDLLAQSGWTAQITVLAGPSTSNWTRAYQGAVAESVRSTLGLAVTIARVANFDALVRSSRSGGAPIFMYGWRVNSSDFGHPSFALGIAQYYFMRDPEIRALVDRRDGVAVEQLLLDKAYVVPVLFYQVPAP